MARSIRTNWLTAVSAVAGLLALPAVVLMTSGCNQGGAGTAARAASVGASADSDVPRVQTVTVAHQDLVQKIEMPGTIEGFETADLYAKVGGYLDSMAVDIGDDVKKGDVLATLSIPEMHKELEQKQAMILSAQADVQQAQAAIAQAQAGARKAAAALTEARTGLAEKQSKLKYRQAEYSRIAKLIERGSLEQKLIDELTYNREAAEAAVEAMKAHIQTAQAEVAAADANIEKARTDLQSALARVRLAEADFERVQTLLEYAQIRAPFDGVITKRFVDPGAFIQPADGNSAARPLLTLNRIDKVRIFLDLPMAQVRWLDRGDRAVLDRINVLPGERFEGEVTRFATSLDRSSRMMRVEVDLENPGQRLLPGFYGYVTLYLEDMNQTPVIPSSALMVDEGQPFVYVVDGDHARRRLVKSCYTDGKIVGIETGLTGGERVIASGGGQITDGQKVIARGEPSEG